MTYRILITDDLSPQSLTRLEEAEGVTYDVIKGLSEAELIERIVDYDGLIVRSSVTVTEGVLKASDRLKVVGRAGVGVDNIDVPTASMLGIIVMNTPGANTVATAEHTFALMLSLLRNIPQAHQRLKEGQWDRKVFTGRQLYRKTIGIIGMGRIGARMAIRCQAFGMEVLAYDPYLSDEVAHELNIKPVDLTELFERSHIISLHAAKTPETEKIINAAAIDKMKDQVRIINAARGALIDEAALIEGLRSGKVGGAALDVFAEEPLPADHPFLQFDNVIVTPHLAASTVEAQRDVGTQIVDQLLDALHDRDFRNALNMPVANASLLKTLHPYLSLAEKLGSLQAQLADDAIQRVEIEVKGSAIRDHIKPITVGLLKGMLQPYLEQTVNYVNAPHLARNRGIQISQSNNLSTRHFTNLVTCRVMWEGGERTVSVTLFDDNEPRLVQIDKYRLDVYPGGFMLGIANQDHPGFIGKIGTILGENDINIAAWRYGRNEAYGQALSFLRVDQDVPDDIVETLLNTDSVNWVKKVKL